MPTSSRNSSPRFRLTRLTMGENKNNNEGGENNKGDGENKKSPVAVLKLSLNCPCLGCVDKIRRIVRRTKGVQEHLVDKPTDLVAVVTVVTVKGIMDVKALAAALKEKLKRTVEVMLPKEEKDGNNGCGGGDNNGGKKKKVGGDGGGQVGESSGGGGGKVEGNKMKHVMQSGWGESGGDDSNGVGGGGGRKKKKVGGQEGDSSGGAGKVEGSKMKHVVQSGCAYENGYYQTIAYMATHSIYPYLTQN